VVTRLAAACAALGIAVGAVIFWAAVLATQGWPYAGFISEAGVAGSPHVAAYRTGILVTAGGLFLLGLALRHTLPMAAALLAAGGAFSSVAAAVNCSAGCPLPPYQMPTFADLVHAAASIAAVLVCVSAMVLAATRLEVSAIRWLSRGGLFFALPLVAVAAVSLLFVGRGRLTGDAERALLLVTTGWAVAVAVAQALSPYHPQGSAASGSARTTARSFAGWGRPLR
jgi:hypothetical protein